MSDLIIGKIGDTLYLQKMVCSKFFVDEEMVGFGYMPKGQPFSIVIAKAHLSFVTDSDLNHYKLQPELNDDFYVVMPQDSITISKRKHDRLVNESEFLSALQAHGVDNWDGYSDAWRDVHNEDEDDE